MRAYNSSGTLVPEHSEEVSEGGFERPGGSKSRIRDAIRSLTYRAKGRVPYPSLRERNVEQPPCRAAAK